MKEVKILKIIGRKEADKYEFAPLLGMVESEERGSVGLWLAEGGTVIATRYLVQDRGYYIVLRGFSDEVVNEFYYETLVEACEAFDKVAKFIGKRR